MFHLPGFVARLRRLAMPPAVVVLLLCGCTVMPAGGGHQALLIQREGVLGTSLEMEIVAPPARARLAADAALGEIARLEALLSTWRQDSELSAYNAGRIDHQALSADVRAVLDACEHWRGVTQGAFSCRLGSLIQHWRQAEASATLPDRVAMRRQARALAAVQPLRTGAVAGAQTVLALDVDGIAKGYIIDRALTLARAAAPQATGIRIDIGGDARYWGRPPDAPGWRVPVADPKAPVDNVEPLTTVWLQSQAIAASGHSSRGYRIGRRWFSHVLDPQQGWPLSYAPSAVVVAPDTATADALATALTVMPIRKGLDLADALPEVAALIVSDSGVAFASSRWPALLADGRTGLAAREALRLQVDYEIPALQATRYRQPYLAIWIEAEGGAAVRQLHVLGDRSRWLSELPAWGRHYGRNDPAAVHGLARPTRKPGHYTVGWDARDDRGRAVAPGRYLLRVEAAREHGGYDQLSIPFVLGPQAIDLRHPGQGEIGRVRLTGDPPPP